jgi:hypothetical protein
MLKVEEKHWAGKTVVKTKLPAGNTRLLLENLSSDKTYQLLFYPHGPNIAPDIGQVAVSLGLLRNNDTVLAFIGQVGLQAHVVWSGRIRVSWELARARAETREGVQELRADEYKLVLRIGQGIVAINLNNANNFIQSQHLYHLRLFLPIKLSISFGESSWVSFTPCPSLVSLARSITTAGQLSSLLGLQHLCWGVMSTTS